VDQDIFDELLRRIGEYQLLPCNRVSDLRNSKSDWTGKFYTGFCASPPSKMELDIAKTHYSTGTSDGGEKQKEARDCLRVSYSFINWVSLRRRFLRCHRKESSMRRVY
jgi:hypothetical protein